MTTPLLQRLLATVCMSLATALASAAQARTIYVAPSKAASFPTLTAALAAVPALRASLPKGEAIEIILPPGMVRLQQPILIDARHSGTAQAPLRIRGATDGSTRFVGTLKLTARPATEADVHGRNLPAGLMAVTLPSSAQPFGLVRRGAYVSTPAAGVELFQGSTRLQPSRWPREGYMTAFVTAGRKAGEEPQIQLPTDAMARWASDDPLWAAGYWAADWAFELAPVLQLDKVDSTMRIAALATPQELRKRVRIALLNGLSDIRQRGDFSIHPEQRLALFLPTAPDRNTVELAVAPQLLKITDARNVEVRDITFDRSLGEAVRITKSSNISLIDCVVRQTGGNGIVVEGGANVSLIRNVVAQTAERGVVLIGGDRQTLTAAGHQFSGGIIADFGLESPSYRPGIELSGVGSAVTGSLITGGEHAAIMLSGNDHRVIGNEISHVLRDTEDAGAIYMGRDWTFRGIQISDNFIHDLGDPNSPKKFLSGVYLDDQASGALVTGNVIVGGNYSVVIGGGRDNQLLGNTLYRPHNGGVHFDERGLREQRTSVNPMLESRLKTMPVTSRAWRQKYPALADLTPAQFGQPAGNMVWRNIVVGAPVLVADSPSVMALVGMKDNRRETAFARPKNGPGSASLRAQRLQRLQRLITVPAY